MLKRALKIATTFGVLLAGYAGYVQLFAVVATRLAPARTSRLDYDAPAALPSESKQEAIQLARDAFGAEHWSADPDLTIRYYNVERGYWMYAGKYERLEEGRRVKFYPFAVVWRSKDQRSLKTVTADEAIVDFDHPFLKVGSGPKASKVMHAWITGDVRLRDNKGTPANPRDDLMVGPLTYLEYDDNGHEIRSDSPVVIQDRDLRATGIGLKIDLRPSETPAKSFAAGFSGAKTAWLLRKVHIIIDDVTRSGVLPGEAPPPPRASGDSSTPAQEKTPIELLCDGPARFDLPKPKVPVRVGPPAPPDPTHAEFKLNVRVLRGARPTPGPSEGAVPPPDQLHCDTFRLVLVPAEKTRPTAPTAGTEAADPVVEDQGGPGTELTLRQAQADGHAVWLLSEAQGIKARGNQLIYKKFGPDRPDETYFRADSGSRLWLEKVETTGVGEDRRVQSVTVIRTLDATLFNNGQGLGNATVVARGPGDLETRPDRGQEVERTAAWQDELKIWNQVEGDQLYKFITLTGTPRIQDIGQFDLTSDGLIKICLSPKRREPAAGPQPAAEQGSTRESFEINWLKAEHNAHLVADRRPADPKAPPAPPQVIDARDRLDVVFQHPPAPARGAAQSVVTMIPSAPAESEPNIRLTSGPAAPVVALLPPTMAAESEPAPEPPPAEPNRPAQPELTVQADHVWAEIIQEPGNNTNKGELRQARLRGSARFHQGPEPGKERGIDVIGEAVDVVSHGKDRARIDVHGVADHPAEVATDEFWLQGPIIGLDQQVNFAWVDGAGKLVMMAQKDAARQDDPGRDREAPAEKKPMVVTWLSKMRFLGQPSDSQLQVLLEETDGGFEQLRIPANLLNDPYHPTPALAVFTSGVRTSFDDAQGQCEIMGAVMDRPIRFAKVARDPGAENEPRPKLAEIRFANRVRLVNLKYDPQTRLLLEKQQVVGELVSYEKESDFFQVEGAGDVRLYDRGTQNDGGLLPAPGGGRDVGNPGPGRISRIANPSPRLPVVNPRAAIRDPAARVRPRPQPGGAAQPPRQAQNPMLIRIRFRSGMQGQLGGDPRSNRGGTRQAEFFQDVKVIRGPVANFSSDLDFDRRPSEAVTLDAVDRLQVENQPRSGAPARNLLFAEGNAKATTNDTTIVGDRITYDSGNELFYVYGLNGRPVQLAQQRGLGLPPIITPGEAAWYNRASGRAGVLDPRGGQFIDVASGAAIQPPPLAPPFGRPMRIEPLLPGRGDKERRSYNGK